MAALETDATLVMFSPGRPLHNARHPLDRLREWGRIKIPCPGCHDLFTLDIEDLSEAFGRARTGASPPPVQICVE